MKILPAAVLVPTFILLLSQIAASQVTLSKVLKEGTHLEISGNQRLFVDGVIKQDYTALNLVSIYEEGEYLYAAIYTADVPFLSFIYKKTESYAGECPVFAVHKIGSGVPKDAAIAPSVERNIYLSAGNSLDQLWRVSTSWEFYYGGRLYEGAEKSWE